MLPADPETASRVRELLHVAAARGMDPVLLLSRRGFLLHPAERKLIEDAAIASLAERLEELTVDQLLGRRPHTLNDLKKQIVQWLNDQAAAA